MIMLYRKNDNNIFLWFIALFLILKFITFFYKIFIEDYVGYYSRLTIF